MKSPAATLVLFLCAALAAGAGRAAGAKDLAPVVLGAVYNMSGAQAELDIPSLSGARLAVAQANRAGGVLGRPVVLAVVDGKSMPDTLRARTAELLEKTPSVVALMGLSDTDMVLAAASVAARHRRLFLTSGATSPRLPAQVPDYLFLVCFGDNVQAAAAAEWAYRNLAARTVSVLFNSEMSYTRLLHAYFQTRFTQLGGHVLSVEGYTPAGLARAVGRLQRADVVFLAAGPEDAPTAVRLLRRAGFDAPIVGGDGFDSADLWRRYRDVSKVYFTTHAYLDADNKDPDARRFRTTYGKAYRGAVPDAFAALGYDVARLLLAAIAAAGSADPAEVRAAVSRTSGFKGVTGTITYTGGGAIPRKSVTIVRIDRGRRVFVGQWVPADIPAP